MGLQFKYQYLFLSIPCTFMDEREVKYVIFNLFDFSSYNYFVYY